MATIQQLRLGERENGYKQCYNDLLKIMCQYQAENPIVSPITIELLERLQQQLAIREVSGWAHPEEVINPLLPLNDL